MSMSRLISSWPVQLRDAATAGDPVHDDGADEIRPSPAEATRQTRDAAVLRLLRRLPSSAMGGATVLASGDAAKRNANEMALVARCDRHDGALPGENHSTTLQPTRAARREP
jgi:hypothetical protein